MAVHRWVLHNGRIRDVSESMLSPGQLGLLAGWGVFSTLRVQDGVLFAWERHWKRMSDDARLMNVPMPSDAEELRRDLLRLVEANNAPNATLRIVVVRNSGGLWEGPPTGRKSDVVALTSDLAHWGTGVRLMYQSEARHSRGEFTHTKILSWSQNLRWYEQAHDLGFDECILLNERGEVTECTSANVFAVQGHEVLTPPVSAGCLPGITRDILLHEIRIPGIQISESELRPEDLEGADDVFITSTTRDLLGVEAIGDRPMRKRSAIREKLLGAYRQYLTGYISARRLVPVAG